MTGDECVCVAVGQRKVLLKSGSDIQPFRNMEERDEGGGQRTSKQDKKSEEARKKKWQRQDETMFIIFIFVIFTSPVWGQKEEMNAFIGGCIKLIKRDIKTFIISKRFLFLNKLFFLTATSYSNVFLCKNKNFFIFILYRYL